MLTVSVTKICQTRFACVIFSQMSTAQIDDAQAQYKERREKGLPADVPVSDIFAFECINFPNFIIIFYITGLKSPYRPMSSMVILN